MRRRRRPRSSGSARELGFADDDRVIGFTGTFGGWHGIDVLAAAIPRICAADAGREVPAHRRRHPQAAARCRGRAPRPRRPGPPRRPRAAGRRRAAAEGVRHLRLAAQQPHGRQQVLRIADQDVRIHGDGRRHRRAAISSRSARCCRRRCAPADLHAADGGRHEPAVGAVHARRRRRVRRRPWSGSRAVRTSRRALGRNARQAVADHYSWQRHVERLWTFAGRAAAATARAAPRSRPATPTRTRSRTSGTTIRSDPRPRERRQPHTLEWFQEVERYRYGVYAPWMPRGDGVRGARRRAGARDRRRHGHRSRAVRAATARIVTDVDLSAGHLQLAQENFRLRGLTGRFVHHDAESLPFDDDTLRSRLQQRRAFTTRRTPAKRSPKSCACSSPAAGRSSWCTPRTRCTTGAIWSGTTA